MREAVKETTFLDLVLKHFDYPLRDHGFSVVYQTAVHGFGPQVSTFALGRCIVAFVLDRGGDPYIEVGSAESLHLSAHGLPEPSFDIGIIVGLLKPGVTTEELTSFYPWPDKGLPLRASVDKRLAELARKIRPYWQRLLELCASGELNQRRQELEELSARRHEAIMRDIFKAGDGDSIDDTGG